MMVTLFPKATEEQTFPKSYENNILTIGVYNSMSAQQITMKKHLLMESINKKFGPNTVKKISISMCEQREDQEIA